MLRRGGAQRENELVIEKHECPFDRSYFKVHLVLEHHVLRKMDARERCVMSRIEPGEGMTTAEN